MATALRVSFCFFCDAHLWCQVSRTLLQYFQRYRLFSIFHFFVANRMTSSLHNRKMSISLKRKKIFQKEKRHSSVFWKVFQISTKQFSFHRHLNGVVARIASTVLQNYFGIKRRSFDRFFDLSEIIFKFKKVIEMFPCMSKIKMRIWKLIQIRTMYTCTTHNKT